MLSIDSYRPKISCLMITADGRFDYLKQSVHCYADQTYKNKELLIVTDSGDEYKTQIRDLIADHDDIHLIELRGRYTLGALRNISMAICEGEVFVQWDDDDFNMPDRLMIQYNWLSKSDKPVCYLSDQLHYFFPTQELYWQDWWAHHSNHRIQWSLIPGTLMAYKKDFDVKYPSAGKFAGAGEDSVLSDELALSDRVILLKGRGDMQVYSYHGKNVWNLAHHRKIAQYRSHEIAHMLQNRQKICRTLKYLNFSPVVKVMGKNGLAFTYEADNVE